MHSNRAPLGYKSRRVSVVSNGITNIPQLTLHFCYHSRSIFDSIWPRDEGFRAHPFPVIMISIPALFIFYKFNLCSVFCSCLWSTCFSQLCPPLPWTHLTSLLFVAVPRILQLYFTLQHLHPLLSVFSFTRLNNSACWTRNIIQTLSRARNVLRILISCT